MSYELIIAEKPSVAEKIANALSTHPIRKFFKKTSYFEVLRDGKRILILPAVGHLYSLKQNSRGFPALDLKWVPSYEANTSAWYAKSYLDAFKEFAKGADLLINAADYDIEGSLIGYNIARFSGDISKTKRMRFSTLTQKELLESYLNLEDIDTNNALAGETRHMIDWLYGINLSRAIMNSLRSVGRSKTLSIGRVQGPMLKFLAEREEDIKKFITSPFWDLFAHVNETRFKHTPGNFKKKEDAENAKKNTDKTGKINISSETKPIYPFPAFDFTSLQTEAYRIYGFTPVQTQKIAQGLYENTYISYPRTASQKLPHQLNLPSIIQRLTKIYDYKEIAQKLITSKRFKPREGKKEDAHPALYPTGNYGRLSSDENKIYDLITRRFLAAFAEPAEVRDRTLVLLSGSERYSRKSRKIIKANWLSVYIFSHIKGDDTPEYTENEEVNITKLELSAKMTAPPKRFSPATILQLMEKEEIGTKTTRALILETLYKRGYVSGKQLTVTPLGTAVYSTFNTYSPKIVDPTLTRQLDMEMGKIQEGKLKQEQVISDAKIVLLEILKDFDKNKKPIGSRLLENLRETEKFAPCKCGNGGLRVLQKNKSKFLGCSAYPNCRFTYSLPSGSFTFAELCESCNSPKIWSSKGRRKYKACLSSYCPAKIEKLKKKYYENLEKAKLKKEKALLKKSIKIVKKPTIKRKPKKKE